MKNIKIKTEFIKLGDLLKLAGAGGTGGQAKLMIQDGLVQVNSETVLQRGKKIFPKDIIQIGEDISLKVIKE